jgi:predicted deacylase
MIFQKSKGTIPNMNNPIHTTIDFGKTGVQSGVLSVPHSHDLSGWAKVQIPIMSVVNGDGPTVLLMAGNHGDEYQGQIAIMKLMRELDKAQVRGRIIMIPILNMPASKAATRLSPLDGENFNRCFPGKVDGSISEMLAHYLTHVLFPISDVVIDLHTGGRGVYFYPCAHMHLVDDFDQRRKMARATMAYNTDFAFLYADVAGSGLLPVEAENQGKIVVTTEMGGGEVVSQPVHQICQDGLKNVLVHLGVIEGTEEMRESKGLAPIRWVQALDQDDYIFAPESGLFESLVDIGTDVRAGQALAAVHFPERPNRPAEIIEAKSDGIVIAHRGPTITQQGDILVCLAHDVPQEILDTF